MSGPRRDGRTCLTAAWVMLAIAVEGCASVPHTPDYILGLTCVVVDESGSPIRGADVILQLGEVAFRGPEAVRDVRQATGGHGSAVFMLTSHVRSTPFAIRVRKAGYATTEMRGVAGSGPQGTHLRITLIPSRGRGAAEQGDEADER